MGNFRFCGPPAMLAGPLSNPLSVCMYVCMGACVRVYVCDKNVKPATNIHFYTSSSHQTWICCRVAQGASVGARYGVTTEVKGHIEVI